MNGEQRLSFSCIVSAVSGFIFGYSVVTSGMLLVDASFVSEFCSKLQLDFDACQNSDVSEQPGEWISFTSYFTSLFSLGAMVGSSLSGFLADRIGRRLVLVFGSMFFAMGTICTLLAPNKGSVYFARILAGMAVGLMSCTSPVYIAEIATKEIRGRVSSWMPLILTLGLLFGSLSDKLAVASSQVWLYATEGKELSPWRMQLGLVMVPAVIIFFGMIVVPESPRWLMANSGYRQSEKALKQLRQQSNVKEELMEIANSCTLLQGNGGFGGLKMLLAGKNQYRLLVSCGLQICNLVSGIGIIQVFGPVMLVELGGIPESFSVVALYSMAFLGTFVASSIVDRTGRRTLLLRGGLGVFAGNAGAAAMSYLYYKTDFLAYGAGCILFMCVFMYFFSISWGPICWLYPPEIYPLNVRASAVALSTLVNYGTLYLSSFGLVLLTWIGLSTLLASLACCTALSLYFIYYCVPETKGVDLEDMDHLFELFRSSQLKGFFAEVWYGSVPLIQRESESLMGSEADKLLANKVVHV